ncbi:MAG TPA: flagellar biosynthetic protein FliO [Terriglobia bacterium]|nr:flagellar biosynthetic protein FliO [Terriglobia bacterium]
MTKLMLEFVTAAFKKITSGARGVRVKRKERSMRLCETLSLGDRRFLAVVLVEQQKFLVGAAGNSVALLARLSSPSTAQESLSQVEEDALFDARECRTWR